MRRRLSRLWLWWSLGVWAPWGCQCIAILPPANFAGESPSEQGSQREISAGQEPSDATEPVREELVRKESVREELVREEPQGPEPRPERIQEAASPCPDGRPPQAEICDGLDNDCDGAIDEVPRCVGCADGQREGFVDAARYPTIAACSGGFSVPGVHTHSPSATGSCSAAPANRSLRPTCQRKAGDDSANPTGQGCNVSDLCAPGWHVCTSAAEVKQKSPSGCRDATPPGAPPLFFVTRQSSTGCLACATGTSTDSRCNSSSCRHGCKQTAETSNDVFGCGNIGSTPASICGPLNRSSNNLCGDLQNPWRCRDSGSGLCEAFYVTKIGPSHGGVLCCRD